MLNKAINNNSKNLLEWDVFNVTNKRAGRSVCCIICMQQDLIP